MKHTTKNMSQVSSSLSIAVKLAPSRDSPNQTTWGRTIESQPGWEHLYKQRNNNNKKDISYLLYLVYSVKSQSITIMHLSDYCTSFPAYHVYRVLTVKPENFASMKYLQILWKVEIHECFISWNNWITTDTMIHKHILQWNLYI